MFWNVKVTKKNFNSLGCFGVSVTSLIYNFKRNSLLALMFLTCSTMVYKKSNAIHDRVTPFKLFHTCVCIFEESYILVGAFLVIFSKKFSVSNYTLYSYLSVFQTSSHSISPHLHASGFYILNLEIPIPHTLLLITQPLWVFQMKHKYLMILS